MSSRNRVRAIIAVVLLAPAGALMLGRPQATAHAQQPAGQAPTTVQLPTFQQFSLQTSVVAPDRGSMVLGGVNRAASGSSSTGTPGLSHLPGASRLFRNRAIGSESSSTQARGACILNGSGTTPLTLIILPSAARWVKFGPTELTGIHRTTCCRCFREPTIF